MKPRALVVTTVHRPDDTRIRERMVRTLAEDFDVRYATRRPGPSDRSDVDWVALPGGRLMRNLSALGVCLFSHWDVLVIHDPELLPAGMLAKATRRRSVVFDVHENFPGAALTREWVPAPLRRPLSAMLRSFLRLAERMLTLTLAEAGYQELFVREHVVFPNFPDTSSYPAPTKGTRSVVYLGDVTPERGARVAVEACRASNVPLTFVGPVSATLRRELTATPGDDGLLRLSGELPNPVAIETIRTGGVGISPLLNSPNYRHSAPTKILEYLALGLPVVASDLPGTRRLVDDLDAVELVPPGDAELLAAAIERSLEAVVREKAARQAHEVRERFRWPGDEVSRFYRSLV